MVRSFFFYRKVEIQYNIFSKSQSAIIILFMSKVTFLESQKEDFSAPAELMELLKQKRNLTAQEIQVLEKNHNTSEFSSWKNVFVPLEKSDFDCSLISNSHFQGCVVLGRTKKAVLKHHNLELEVGIYNSLVKNTIFGNDCVVRNVTLVENYQFGDRALLFDVNEITCSTHAKFGNGYLFDGEDESERKWIGIANENDGRAILPFENIIPADAYLWSANRDDSELLKRFVEITDGEIYAGALQSAQPQKINIRGIAGHDVVIKNTLSIIDAKIGDYAYIKGASKIKNVTILSGEDEVSQIGEGVEMVNGIMNAGSHVFYQAVAIRFVIGRNCQLKYGARLLNSFLGDNSTVSCCELLNNMIFPFHEQHHNSSFLIASTVMGQSNIAAGATIGSNHNSRSPDGEIIAHRGFWPGLCSDFKHNSRFASFVLASKGSYQYELDIQYPFCLLAPGDTPTSPVHILPAWWFMYDMYAIVRNRYKFAKRDKRFIKVQNIETNPFAPDVMQEVCFAIKRIIELTSSGLSLERQDAKDFLHHNPDSKMTLTDMQSQKKFGATIYKPVQGYKMYRKVLKYFSVSALKEYCNFYGEKQLSRELIAKIKTCPLFTKWQNVGGQVIPDEKIQNLFTLIKSKEINSWNQVHEFYNNCQKEYLGEKTRYAIYLLEELYSDKIENFSQEIFKDIVHDVSAFSEEMYNSSVSSREKDFTDYYRCMVYKSKDEMASVVGSVNDNDFLKNLESDTKLFNGFVKTAFSALC